ncbi:phytoene dehydrogenase-like oxidoreductase [Mycolicibacterium phlei]|jgi:phytoene dehydrogenase-like protein|uniref:phytoene desaturase family protein n=1 Tax=Mycolicibacterium phlei TaxID=1771 RepID=UPI00025AF629|nr:NAD(P)/FAD-dependent oxidoreductase [Mycolicibacterium phlei]EID10782.1 phytoene dehydrogenase-like oxidoreductase [Mycolicibacterium phlei RIVM601174]KXW69713.1 dehydrogenase [Mycolicibacterium phlei DSM 43072]KXW72974.1 dehydrogenase [Mycolicibacterium phlei DSM 43070]KXW78741.1 dehydrogenase [Mycolicibacterium phlei DSM 43071]MBF4193103.1 phytoene dehydrogenase-like oxidoreductase [Mycolicibacterium phlei]
MTDFDAIVIGAGHNGLTAAVLLQKAGLRTLCLDSKLYAGGMASTVELFDGFRFEIAGSVQIPTSAVVSRELGLDQLPTVELDVMSVSLRGVGDEPLVYYTDPMKLLTHINEVHGAEAVNGMAGLMAWCQAPTRALGRFDAGSPPKTLDEMYACATNEFERSSITDMLFGSVTDVLDRYLPDREKHGALRGMLALLACNTTYRGPETPGTAAALAYGFAVPDENALLVKKLKGGIGALTTHLNETFTAAGGQIRLRSKVAEITVADGRVTGVRLEDGTALTAPVVVSGISPDVTVTRLIDPNAVPAEVRDRFSRLDHRGSYLQMHFALDGIPEFAAPYELLNDPAMQSNIGIFSTPEDLQQQWEDCRHGIVPADPSIALQIPSVNDPGLAPPGKHAASAFALWFPITEGEKSYGEMKVEMGRRVIEKIGRLAPNFESLILRHTTFTPKHMGTMFGAPGGDYCHGLIHPDQIGPNRPGPKGYVDQPIPIDGLYLGSAGCHGGPGITFVPGYNAAKQALADAG